MNTAVEQAGAALAAESARMAGLGWMRGTSGNLSVVLTRDPLRLAVTVSGLDKGELTSADVVVVDEMSMVSLTLMAQLLEAVRPDARLLLVGDPDQLTSVDAGAVLADLVARPVTGTAEPAPAHCPNRS